MDAGVRLLLVRHGETVWNQENRWQGQADTALSHVGYRQARQLGRQLGNANRQIEAIYTSDLCRARETAAILGKTLDVTPIETMAWREMDIGSWSGLTTAEVAERHQDEWERVRNGEDLPRGGGETFRQFQQRILCSAAQFVRDHEGGQIIVVTHGGAVRALLLHCQGLAAQNFGKIEKIANTGVSEVSLFASGHATIHSVNDVTHLDGGALSGEVVDA